MQGIADGINPTDGVKKGTCAAKQRCRTLCEECVNAEGTSKENIKIKINQSLKDSGSSIIAGGGIDPHKAW